MCNGVWATTDMNNNGGAVSIMEVRLELELNRMNDLRHWRLKAREKKTYSCACILRLV